jgi:Flp pilus assembly pilin Flp
MQAMGQRKTRWSQAGQAATEYILVVGLIVIPLAIGFNRLQSSIKQLLVRLATYLYGPGI